MRTYSNRYTYIFIVALLLLQYVHTIGQQRELSMNINYSIGQPVGEFKEFLGSTSFRGWNANILYGFSDKVSAGLSVGFQDFYEKHARRTYTTTEGSTISAVLTNSLQTLPILAKLQYQLGSAGRLQPYAAFAAGANIITYSQYLGEFPSNRNKINFAARPELGILMPISARNQSSIQLGTGFNYMPANINEVKNYNNVFVNAGIKFLLRN